MKKYFLIILTLISTSTISYGGIRTISLANNEFKVYDPFLYFERVKDDFFKYPMTLKNEFSYDIFKIDIKETEKEYIIEAELAGILKEDIDLSYENQSLKINVIRNQKLEKSSDSYIRKERSTNSMTRTFYLPDIKQDEINARLKDGILTITLPKDEETLKVNKIKINWI